MRVLIAEDEAPIREMLRLTLTQAGYDCDCAQDGEQACDLADLHTYDLCLMDIMMPLADGFEVAKYLKPLGIPVIFLTARNQTGDKVRALLDGAEDYIVKPFVVAELLARMEVVLRRYHKDSSILHYAEYELDLTARTVTVGGELKELTPKEFDLFVLLVRSRGSVLFRDYLYQSVWDMPLDGETRTLDLHIQRLRRKLSLGKRLKSVYGMGYRLDTDRTGG